MKDTDIAIFNTLGLRADLMRQAGSCTDAPKARDGKTMIEPKVSEAQTD